MDQNLQTELELRQILLLSFELLDVELSEMTLVKLIEISEEYLPQYANILTMTGNNQKALNVYLDYLDKNPDDEKTLIKFGMFLIKVNEINSAETVFKNVLSINPSNLTAQKYLSNLFQ